MKASSVTKKTQPKKQHQQSFIRPKKANTRSGTSQESLFIQAKLSVGQPNDKYEKEADAMADKIVKKSNSPSTKIQQKVTSGNTSTISRVQLKSTNNRNTTSTSAAFATSLNISKGGGLPMTKSVKKEMEFGFGRNFNNVRIHTDSNAIQMSKNIGAKAFTNGNNIYFNSNRYSPNSTSGKRLLAHELTHVVQQKNNTQTVQRDPDPSAATSTPNTTQTQATIDAVPTLGGQIVMTSSMLSTKVGPPSQNQDIFLIIGPTTKISQIGTVLLPLWNTATPVTPEGSTTPNITTPLTADELAKGLLVFNRYRLAIPPAAVPPAMTNWKIGMRFPLPIRVDTTTNEGILHPLIIRNLAGIFDTSWNHLLDELPQLITNTTPADLQQQAQDFLATNTSALSRGIGLMVKATRNAVANEQLILEIFNAVGNGAFDLALDFMQHSVNRDISLLQGQEAGARILARITSLLATAPASLSADQQSKLQRSQHMLGLVSAVQPERLTTWEATTVNDRMVYVMRLLIDNYNFPVNGAAGLVGNLYSESGVLPNRIEGSNIATPMRAKNFSGSTRDFTPTQIMNRSFSGQTGPRKPGIGLAQWTSANRREGLFEHRFRGREDGENIIFNMEAQVDYLVTELMGSYTSVYNVITANDVSVNDASDEVIYNFEIPGSILSGGSKLPRSNSQVQTSFGHRRNNSNRALRVYNESQANTEE
ncbi:phage tail tip lysozyme [Kordia sp.]|uniref:phage tail tip lysozyme n=1 Tax=Kordia sp. TaxID=1965332 RepID=UPI0025B8F27A|nr:phage tail tip lysozyme [Kordia sp.]MCH2193608.1 phage tail tip lysozyme [Kordia sp.]